MAWLNFFLDSPIPWQAWYAFLPLAYGVLLLRPAGKVSRFFFDRGWAFLFPVVYLIAFAANGLPSVAAGTTYFSDLVGTSGRFEMYQVAAAFCITATAADLAFASIVLRKYAGESMFLRAPIAACILMIGWLLGVVIYMLLLRIRGPIQASVRIGPVEVS